MKLFQIEEPDGSPADPDAPGAAVGIDVSRSRAEVAVAIGGNAVVLADRDGFELDLVVPSATAPAREWQILFEGVQCRAERALARPVTHAVIVVSGSAAEQAQSGAVAAGLVLLRVLTPDQIADQTAAAAAAAILAEDLAPRSGVPE